MKVATIICEYNPFHNGHKFHIEETKRLAGIDAVVVIMSGNFVQRGETAIFDKKLRANAAIASGADLCLELPTIYSAASAEFFALGAIKTLNALGTCDFLSFGVEEACLETIQEIAGLLAEETGDFSDSIKKELSLGVSYPKARANAVAAFLGNDAKNIMSSPNNILAIEYLKALIRTKSLIQPVAVLRKGANHDSHAVSGDIASASFIRDLILGGKDFSAYIPDSAKDIFKDAKVHSLKNLEKAILCQLLKMPLSDLSEVADIGEGIENRIKAKILTAQTLDELSDLVKTKRYTHSRVRRIMLSAFLGISRDDQKSDPPYIRVLGYNEVGQKLLSSAKKRATLPIVQNTSQVNRLKDRSAKDFWERERIFDKIYEFTEL